MWSVSSLGFALVLSLAMLSPLAESQAVGKEVTPNAYHLKINASGLATSDTYMGAVLVNMTVVSSISSLVLHSENLTLNESSLVMMKKHLYLPKWEPVKISNVSVDQGLLNVTFSPPLAYGEYSLYVEYFGHYQSSMAGFAKVGYYFKHEQKFLGVTGLGPTNARKVFPCFDIPGVRTQFSLEVVVDRPYAAISTIRASVQNDSETSRVFLFSNYPTIAVYQLAWAVIDNTSYTLREEHMSSTVVHTRAPYLYWNHTLWGNQVTAKLVEAVGVLTGVPYSSAYSSSSVQGYSKIEQVVLPEFFVGTSESFGFMSFSEESILVALNKSSTKHTQQVALTLTRAVLQQWFGDIIFIDSWENSWMLTGLVQYLQYPIAESLSEMSDWGLEDQAAVRLTQAALALDSFEAHPLTVHSDDEKLLVTTVGDELTKFKGGAIIRMLKDVFGGSFKEAMNTYVMASNQYPKFNPTSPTSFWEILYGVATDQKIDLGSQSLGDIMEPWINSSGYPVLSVASNTSHYIISQPNTNQWWVPVTYKLSSSPIVSRVWLQPGNNFALPVSSSKWILLNLNQSGYFRVNYTSALWQALNQQLMTDLTQLPYISRAQLIDDAFAIDNQMALEFSNFLRAETGYLPWMSALQRYETLINSLAGYSSAQFLQQYVLDLMSGVIDSVGFSSKPEDNHVDKLKRSLVLEKACQFGHQGCIEKAVTNLRTWMAKTYFDADLSPALLCAGVANSSSQVWENVWSMYHVSIYPSIRLALLQSLTCSTDQDLLYQFLNNITSTRDHVVSAKDKTVLLETLSSKPFGAHFLLNWLLDRLGAQSSNSSAETSTLIPMSSTSEQMQTTESSATTTSSNETVMPTEQTPESEQLRSRRATVSEVQPEILPESDVRTILSLIVPMLNKLEDGTKLESFLLLGNSSGLSSDTLEMMRNATQKIYLQSDRAQKSNGKLITWLEAEAASSTSTPGGSFNPSTQSPASPKPTPSSASHLLSGTSLASLLACSLAMVLHALASV